MDHHEQRQRMVQQQLMARDITDPAVLEAMRVVPREHFVPDHVRADAYGDHPLPIGSRQTISQPYIVAVMAQAAQVSPDDTVLEVGTGSGYGAAVLAEIAHHVVTVERIPELADRARSVLADLGYDTIDVHVADGTGGWAAAAPYDAIVVTAGGPRVPDSLVDQLAEGGRLVIPVGRRKGSQELMRLTRRGDDLSRERLGGVRFVPLIGDEGW